MIILAPDKDRIELQRLATEIESRQAIISYILANNINIETEQFQKYQNDYRDFFLKYEQRKIQFQNEFIIPQFGKQVASWSLDFNTNEVTVNLRQE